MSKKNIIKKRNIDGRRYIKNIAVLCMALVLLFVCACGKAQSGDSTLSLAPEDDAKAPSDAGGENTLSEGEEGEVTGGETENSQSTGSQSTGLESAGSTPAVTIISTVAYVLDGQLYGGVEYKNISGAAIVVNNAEFTFTYGGKTSSSSFVPVTANKDVVLPGETSYCTLWLTVNSDEPLDSSVNVTLEASLTPEHASKAKQQLYVSNARVIKNYPGFATLSGKLSNYNENPYDLNMVYVGFYDDGGNLLAVWHFTRNALLHNGESTAFVVHMQSLPIEGLDEKTHAMRFRAFSMQE